MNLHPTQSNGEKETFMATVPEAAVVDGARWWQSLKCREHAVSAFKAGLAAVLCLWFGHLFQLAHSYWAAISAIVVMGSDTAVTFTSCRDRLIGTAIGAFMGWMTFYAWHGHYLVYGLAIAVCIFVCSLLEFDKAGRLAGVALTIVVLVQTESGPGKAAIDRFLEVGLGIVVALAVTLLVFPPRRAAAS
jgi:uncharacterized membrane protein YgaE (UPF0421/DUF939 family)